MFDVVSADTSTLEDFYFSFFFFLYPRRYLFRSSYQWRFHLGHKHRLRPPKSDFGETILQQHRGLNQICHKTTSKMLKNKRIT